METASTDWARRDGVDLVGRNITLDVDEVLWRSPQASEVPSGTLTMSAVGWTVDKDELKEAAFSQSPRLEVGHTYVLTLVWMKAECDDSDGSISARWAQIGTAGALPADDSILGRGEYEGSVAAQVNLDGLPDSAMLPRVAGKSPLSLAEELGSTPAVTRIDLQQGIETC